MGERRKDRKHVSWPGKSIEKDEGVESEVIGEVWVDASVEKGKVGMGMLIKQNGKRIVKGYRMTDDLSSREAELKAIKQAVKYLKDNKKIGKWKIYTDSIEAIQKIEKGKSKVAEIIRLKYEIMEKEWKVIWSRRNTTEENKIVDREAREARKREEVDIEEKKWNVIEKIKKEKENEMLRMWQREWDESEDGRPLYDICSKVGLDHLGLTAKGVQLATGHGKFEGYIKRFRLKKTNGQCKCGWGIEDREHVVEECRLKDRIVARREIGQKLD